MRKKKSTLSCSVLFKSAALAAAAVLAFGVPLRSEAARTERIVGVKIYEYKKDFAQLISLWKTLGINHAFVSIDLARNRDFMSRAKANGIITWVILPVFYNPEKLKQDPDLYARTAAGGRAEKDWVQFVCPSRADYRAERLEFIRNLLKECQPDGLSIDFIRFFVFWEKVFPNTQPDPLDNTCFCSHCLQSFQAYAQVNLPKNSGSVRGIADWITKNHLKEWSEWKCQTITSMVASIAQEARKVKPEIRLNVHAVPWREKDFGQAWKTVAGQDVGAIAPLVDYLSPMCYAHMVRQDPAWIHSVVVDIQRRAKAPIIASIQVKESNSNDKISASLFKEYLKNAFEPPSVGVVFWNWEALDQDAEKRGIVQDVAAEFLKSFR
jgi:hypothetical protein